MVLGINHLPCKPGAVDSIPGFSSLLNETLSRCQVYPYDLSCWWDANTNKYLNTFSVVHDNYGLLCYLLMYFDCLYRIANNMDPDQVCLGAVCMIRVHSVCF